MVDSVSGAPARLTDSMAEDGKVEIEVPEGEHPLQSAWSFWYDKKPPRGATPA